MKNTTTNNSGQTTTLVKGYSPKPDNFGKPLFTEGKSIDGLEGKTAKDRLGNLTKTDLYERARSDLYNVLEAYYERRYGEGDQEEKLEEEEDISKYLGKFVIPGVFSDGAKSRGAPRPQRTGPLSNKECYEVIQDYLKNEKRDPNAGEGAIIYANGEQYGSKEDLSGADRLLQRYEAFVNSHVGKQLFKDLGTQPNFDGYAFMDLGKGVLGAMISVDGRQILAINKQYAPQLEGTALETYVLAHEAVHGLGEQSEYKTDDKLYNSFSKAAASTSGTQQKVYNNLANIGGRYTGRSARAAGSAAGTYSGKKGGKARAA